ncbi:MAG: hypothetical protein EOP49_25705, partial [Sphingobacteriales bacterium]
MGFELPVATITGDNPICQGTTKTYTTQTGMTNYDWTVVNGTIQAGGDGFNFVTIFWDIVGTKSLTVNYINANGCAAATAGGIVATSEVAVPTFTSGVAVACQNSGGHVYTTEAGNTDYQWTVTGGTITSGTGTNSIMVTWNTAGPQKVRINYTNSSGCSAINPSEYDVTVNPLPTINVTPASPAICIGTSTNLTASGASTYVWSPATGLSATTGATVTASPIITTIYSVTGTDGNGCVNTKAVTVTVNALPTISVTPSSPAICIGLSTSLTASGASTYVWSPATGLSATTGTTVTASPTGTTTYTVTGTDANGCINTRTVTVTVNPLPTINVSPAAPAICAGLNTSLTASGATTY